MNIDNNIAFKAKPGPEIIKRAKKEFNNNAQRVNRYVELYKDTFSKNLDESTIVDLNADNKYVFSSELFPNLKYVSNDELIIKNDILQSLLQECPKTLARIERRLFRNIIAKKIKKGTNIQDLKAAANNIKNDESRKRFSDNLTLAEDIIKENPDSELREWDFDEMDIKLMKKEAETPGTDLYDLIHSFDKMTLFTDDNQI